MERWYFGGLPRGESSGKGWDPHKVLRNPTKKSAAARKSDRNVKFVESVQTLPSGRVYNKLSDDGIALLLSMCVPLDEDGSEQPANERRCVESVARALQRFGSESQHVIQAFLFGVYGLRRLGRRPGPPALLEARACGHLTLAACAPRGVRAQ